MLKKNERSRRFIRTSFKVQEELMEFHLWNPDYSELFEEEKKWLANWKSVLNGSIGAFKYNGPDLDAHQQLRLPSDILIEIYMAESTILRTEKNGWEGAAKSTNSNG
jgi:hypothetical protein